MINYSPHGAIADVCRRFCLAEQGKHDDACVALREALGAPDASTATVRPYDHQENGSGVVIEGGINGRYGPLTVWLPGSDGYPAEVSFPFNFWRGDRADLVMMRDVFSLAIRTMDEEER